MAHRHRRRVQNLENFEEGYSLKSKKLFAILTLVAFMMTLLPAFAFADDPAVPVQYSTAASTVKVDDRTIDIYDEDADDLDDLSKFTITFKNASNEVIKEQHVRFYVKADSDAVKGIVTNKADANRWADKVFEIDPDEVSSADGEGYIIKTNDAGRVFVFVSATIAGKIEFEFYDNPADKDNVTARLIGSEEITVEVGKGGRLTLTADGVTDDGASSYNATIGDDITLKAEVLDNAGDELEGAKVVFQKKFNNGSWTTIGRS
jgi:hypothetical protein